MANRATAGERFQLPGHAGTIFTQHEDGYDVLSWPTDFRTAWAAFQAADSATGGLISRPGLDAVVQRDDLPSEVRETDEADCQDGTCYVDQPPPMGRFVEYDGTPEAWRDMHQSLQDKSYAIRFVVVRYSGDTPWFRALEYSACGEHMQDYDPFGMMVLAYERCDTARTLRLMQATGTLIVQSLATQALRELGL